MTYKTPSKPAIRYKVVVQQDLVHRHMDQLIEEIWIPGLGACINEKGFCFKSTEPRADGVDTEITEIQYEIVDAYLKAKQNLEDVIGNCF